MLRATIRAVSILLSLVLVLGLAAVAITVTTIRAAGPSQSEIIVALPRGSGLNTIANVLETSGVIRNAQIFALWVRASGNADGLRAGEYAFPPHVTAADVERQLLEGRTYKRRLTVPEGLATERVLALISDEIGRAHV